MNSTKQHFKTKIHSSLWYHKGTAYTCKIYQYRRHHKLMKESLFIQKWWKV